MEINELFDKGIQETQERIKLAIEQKNKIIKDIKRLKQDLIRKERARQIYFGEKTKKVKKEKPEINQKEVKP